MDHVNITEASFNAAKLTKANVNLSEMGPIIARGAKRDSFIFKDTLDVNLF